MIDVQIKERGRNRSVKVSEEGALSVVNHPHPFLEEEVLLKPFRQFCTDDGSSTGDNDMIVNGSSTPVEFYISAHAEEDIYVKSFSIQISDAGAELEDFGALNELTNGVAWTWETQETGSYVLHDGVKTNFDFIRLGLGTPAFGSGDKVFKVDFKGKGTDDAFIPVIDMTQTFGMPYGMRLRKGTKDRIVFTVNDNLAGIEVFNIVAYGGIL